MDDCSPELIARPDNTQEFIEIVRLPDEAVRLQFVGSLEVDWVCGTRKNDDGNALKSIPRPNVFQQLEAGFSR